MSVAPGDIAVLREAVQRTVLPPPGHEATDAIDFAEFSTALAGVGREPREVAISLRLLEEEGLVETAIGLGQSMPAEFTVTSAGVETVIGDLLPEMSVVRHKVGTALVHRRIRDADGLSRELQLPAPLVRHILRAWAAGGWVTLSGEVGADIVVAFSPRLERWLVEDAPVGKQVDGASAAERADSRVPAPSSTRRRWKQWVAVDDKPLFTSSMSKIWRVRDESGVHGGTYALKELRYAKRPGSTAFERFRREVTAMQQPELAHPNIVRPIESFVPPTGSTEQPFMVMALADTSLQRAAKGLRGKLDQALEYCIAIARALEVAHAAGIIHRDVKPANVLLYGDERAPRLGDFGICFLRDDERLTSVDADTVGSADYVAPELQGGGASIEVSPSADVYSLGKTLYAIAAGGDTFPRERFASAPWNLAMAVPGRGLEHLNGLLECMVTELPGSRFASMTECREQMERALENVYGRVPYKSGMYGGIETAVERMERLQKAFSTSTGHNLADQIQDAQRRASTELERIIAGVDAQGTVRTGAANQVLPAAADAVAIAEELMVVGLVLARANDGAEFEQWLSDVTALMDASHERGVSDVRSAPLSLAVTLAIVGVAAYTWHRKRTALLHQLVDAMLVKPHRWIHHRLLSESAGMVLPWTIDRLKASPLVGRIDVHLPEVVERAVQVVHGLVLLRGLLGMQPSDLESAMNDAFRGVVAEAFPGYYAEGVAWSGELARVFSQGSPFAKSIAEEVLGVQLDALPGECARITPAILRSGARLENERHRDFGSAWLSGGGYAWNQWCGVVLR